jgi:hypothetical protein
MNVQKQIESHEPTPEQLLQMLDLQLVGERSKRAGRSRNRAMILVFGIFAIIAAGTAALVVAQQMLLDLQQHGASPHSSAPALEN